MGIVWKKVHACRVRVCTSIFLTHVDIHSDTCETSIPIHVRHPFRYMCRSGVMFFIAMFGHVKVGVMCMFVDLRPCKGIFRILLLKTMTSCFDFSLLFLYAIARVGSKKHMLVTV